MMRDAASEGIRQSKHSYLPLRLDRYLIPKGFRFWIGLHGWRDGTNLDDVSEI